MVKQRWIVVCVGLWACGNEEPKPQPGALTLGDVTPSPLISRNKPVFANGVAPERARATVNGVYGDYAWNGDLPSAASPAWFAINIGEGPTSVYAVWTSTGNFNYDQTPYGGPGDYTWEVSNNSTNGANGDWHVRVSISDNRVRTRGHLIDFGGQSWLRLVVTAGTPETLADMGVAIDEVDVHDASAGLEDAWFFMGDSITAMAFDRRRERQPSFAGLIAHKGGAYFPATLNGGIGGDTTWDAVDRIDAWLDLNPEVRYWPLAFGSNDASRNNPDTRAYRANMTYMIERALAAGKAVVVPAIPYASDGTHQHVPAFNVVLDELREAYGLLPGPDLYTWFLQHPEELSDGLHPTHQGAQSINRLWQEAMRELYGL